MFKSYHLSLRFVLLGIILLFGFLKNSLSLISCHLFCHLQTPRTIWQVLLPFPKTTFTSLNLMPTSFPSSLSNPRLLHPFPPYSIYFCPLPLSLLPHFLSWIYTTYFLPLSYCNHDNPICWRHLISLPHPHFLGCFWSCLNAYNVLDSVRPGPCLSAVSWKRGRHRLRGRMLPFSSLYHIFYFRAIWLEIIPPIFWQIQSHKCPPGICPLHPWPDLGWSPVTPSASVYLERKETYWGRGNEGL